MRCNGTISYSLGTGEVEFDDNGAPIVPEGEWSSPVDCSVQINKHDNRGRVADSKFTIASYFILIEMQEFSAKRIRLTYYGQDKGEFEVQNIEPIPNLGRIKITV